jgi:hypothetical protein
MKLYLFGIVFIALIGIAFCKLWSICSIFVTNFSDSGQECSDPNEIHESCGTACPITCENHNNPPKMCIEICKSGCFCKSPYIRNAKTGKCVLTRDC